MNDEFIIDWSGRSLDYSDDEVETVLGVMRQADPLTQGKYLKQFEADFSCYNGNPHAFAVSNCTNALDLIAILADLKQGDEVIVPAHTFCATAIPFARSGAKIVWADIDPDTFVVSAKSIEEKITSSTRAVVVVHLYGMVADMEAISEVCRKHDCLIIEDCAQSLGAEFKQEKAGTFGDYAAFSFHAQKSITLMGEGGMLALKSSDDAEKVPGLRHNGIRPFDFEREHYWQPAMGNVDLDIQGVWPHNFCINEVQCALGSLLLKRLDEMNDLRIRRANQFIESLLNYPELSFQKVSGDHKHVYHLLPAKYDRDKHGASSHEFIKTMAYEYKIKTIVQYYPLYRYPLFQKMGYGMADCPNSDELFDNMVSFPFHLWMSDNDFAYLTDCTVKALNKLRG